MSDIEVEKWKEFRIDSLFDVVLAEGDLKHDDCQPGQIPLVSSGSTNNGIIGYILKDEDGKSKVFTGNKITIDMFCNAYYQPDDFYSVSHGRVNILIPRFEMNKYTGLFITTIINKEKFKYSYGRAVYSDESSRMIIKLPVDIHDKPDFIFMEKYMKDLWGGTHNTTISKTNCNFDVTNWGDFRIGDIFDLKKCKCGCAGDLEDDIGDIEYIGAKKTLNGFMKNVNRTSNEKLVSKGNCIVFICDGEGSVGYSNYMEKDFIGSTTLMVGYNENLNKYNALFIIPILDKEKVRYSYGRKYAPTLANTIIKLPITSDMKPDWIYMENYIKMLPYSDKI